jgi:hypothetical protein
MGVLNMAATNIAVRNRQIKKVLEQRFGRGKIRVRGSRGTGYDWVSVLIEAPDDGRLYSDRYGEVMTLLRSASIEIGTYGYDDPGSDYGFGSKINISFTQQFGPAEYAA